MDTNAKKQELLGLAELVLTEAKAQGASSAASSLSVGKGLSIDVRMSEVEQLEYHLDQSLGMTVYFGQRQGSASTGDFSPEAIRDAVKAACNIAKYTSEDDCLGLADAELMATDVPDLELYHPWDLPADQAIELARECEDAARSYDDRIVNSDGAGISTYDRVTAYANTHGFSAARDSSTHSLNCVVIGKNPDSDSMQRDSWYSYTRQPELMQAAAEVGKKAAEETLKRLGSRKISTRQAPVMYVPQLAAGIFGHFTGAINGGSLYRKASFLLDSLETNVFPDFVNLYERPLRLRGLGSAAYDAEGVATTDRDIVRDGIVQSYILGSYSARKLGMQTTGHASGLHNLTADSTGQGFEEMLREMGTGLLVTELIGSGINGITGDYSRGAGGFWVENGEIQFPVEEITIAGNLKDMFQQIVAIGNDYDDRLATKTGSVLIEQMTISGE